MKGYNRYKDTPDNHDFMSKSHIEGFLRNHGTGTNNRGRWALAKILQSYEYPVVVDAACGTAVNYEVFKQAGIKFRYLGIDRTKGMLDEAKRRYPDITVMQGYVQELPIRDEGVDIVIMRHILEHLQEGYEEAVIEGLRAAEKELVVVFFLDPHDGPEDNFSESDPDENGCTYFWNTYSWPKFMNFVSELGVRVVTEFVKTPGAAHADTIVRLIK